MTKTDRIMEVFKAHDHVLSTAELTSNKIYYADIQKLLKEGLVEKVRRGYYYWVDQSSSSDIVILNNLFPDAILCMDTALFYYGYSDKTPNEWHFAINKNVSKKRVKIDYPFIKAYRVEPYLLLIGETTGTIDEASVRIYDKDRTICDVLRNMNRIDKEVFNNAIQCYVKDSNKNVPHLMQYAKELRVQKKVKDILEVWL